MRAFALALVVMGIGLAQPAHADNAADSNPSITDILPWFVKNHCEETKVPADQLFCGDPELNAVSPKLAGAIQDRMNRLPDRQRSALVMPNALSWPAAYCDAEELTCAKPNSECPAIRPVTCNPDPRYGTWVIETPACLLKVARDK